MNSQTSVEPTQQISQSYYDELISKRHAEQTIDPTYPTEKRTETQLTVNEGEEGHIDITSSFVANDRQAQFEETGPIEYAPTQSQPDLTQFPESQRFKTPATAGRKRKHNGQMVESPIISRNPLLRQGQPSSDTFGLSQAFAGTQAGSSPFAPRLPPNPLSDRPSPVLDQHERPATATSSSPLLPIHEIKRASTEPAVRYVSVRQSQSRRVKQSKVTHEEAIDNDNDIDFSHQEPSIVTRSRLENERTLRIRRQFEEASSPYSREPGLQGVQKRIASGSQGGDSQSSDSYLTDCSEAETEHDETYDVAVRRSSQVKHAGFEDKENLTTASVRVPNTVLRPTRDLEVQASPLLRYTKASSVVPVIDPLSSGPARVDDSQPSPSQIERSKKASNTNSQAAEAQIDPPEEVTLSDTDRDVYAEDSTNNTLGLQDQGKAEKLGRHNIDHHNHTQSDSGYDERSDELPSTVPETTSGANHEGKLNKLIDGVVFGSAPQNTSISFITAASTKFEHQLESPVRHDRQPLMAPATPSNSRRRRMVEVAAEASPRRSGTQSSFNPAEALALDEDPTVAEAFKISQKAATQPNTRINRRSSAMPRSHTASNTPTHDSLLHDLPLPNPDTEADLTSKQVPLELSQEIIKPKRKRLQSNNGTNGSMGYTCSSTKASKWDILSTPEEQDKSKNSTIRHARNSTKQDHEPSCTGQQSGGLTDKANVHQKIARPAISEESPDPIALSLPQANVEMKHKIIAPTMIFACFSGKSRAYYPATCLGPANAEGTRFLVQWDGYEPDEVDSHGVRSLDLRVGDSIKIDEDGVPKVPYVVKSFTNKTTNPQSTGVTDIRGFNSVIVEPKQRRSLPVNTRHEQQLKISISNIYLDSNMWNQLKHRPYVHVPDTRTSPVRDACTPLERPSTPVTPSSRSRRPLASNGKATISVPEGLFAKMIFAVSFDDVFTKDSICKLLESHGGTVLNNGFDELFDPGLVLKSCYSSAGFAALLADKHSRKEKYMQALALGLPCLSGRWIESCISHNRLTDWLDYLLPAGESAALGDAIRSRQIPSMEPNVARLSEMILARPKFFDGCKVIYVTGRGKMELKRAPYLFFLEAMRAGHIEKVSDLEAVIDSGYFNDNQFSWILVDDKDLENARALTSNSTQSKGRVRKGNRSAPKCKVGDNEMIMQSLILGKVYEEDVG